MLISIPVKLQSFRHGKSKIGQDFLSMRFTKLVKFGKEGTGSKENGILLKPLPSKELDFVPVTRKFWC